MAKEKGSQNKEPSSGDLDFKILNPVTGAPFLFSLNSNRLTITHGGAEIGHTVPLARVEDVAKILGVHRMAIPIHMVEHDLPVYSVGDDDFINLQDLKFLMEEVRFSFW
jgi:hypothetical protein